MIMVKIHHASSKVSVVFSKSLEFCNDYIPRTTKVLKAAMLSRTNKHKEKNEQETIMSRLCEAFIHQGFVVTCCVKEKQRWQNYHNYSSTMPLGEPRASTRGTNNARESEA
jgi:hypothetical protein